MRLRWRAALLILLFCAGIGCFLFFTNAENFLGGKVSIPADSLIFKNWTHTPEGYVSEDNPQIIIPSTGAAGLLHSAVITTGGITGAMRPLVFYTRRIGENFSEERSFYPDYTYQNGILTLYIDKNVMDLRVDLSGNAGMVLSGVSRVRYDYKFVVLLPWLAYTAFFLCLLLIPLFLTRARLRSLWNNVYVFQKYTFLLSNLVKKDFTTKYRRSVLGVLWSVLNPLLMMMVITAVFKNIFRIQIDNFPVYYLTGSLLFNFMSEATASSMTSILGAGGLIKKVYIPKYIFPLEKCLFALVNALFSFTAVLIIMPVLRAPFSWTMLLFWVPFLYVLIFSAGLGMILASLTVFFRDINHLYSVWIMAWMYLTPIIYPADILPQSLMPLIRLNPMFCYVNYFRRIVMDGTLPGWSDNLNCLIFSFLFFGLGMIVFKKTQDRFILFI